jgi:predicted peroxiredoxin
MTARRIALMAGVLITLAVVARMTSQSAPQTRDGVFVHLTHGPEDPHRVAMALQMARMMSADKDVLVYCDIKAIGVVLKNSPDIKFSHFPSSKSQLATLQKAGVTVMACPGCMKAAGKKPSDLAPGVVVADKSKFFTFTRGRILTLDY